MLVELQAKYLLDKTVKGNQQVSERINHQVQDQSSTIIDIHHSYYKSASISMSCSSNNTSDVSLRKQLDGLRGTAMTLSYPNDTDKLLDQYEQVRTLIIDIVQKSLDPHPYSLTLSTLVHHGQAVRDRLCTIKSKENFTHLQETIDQSVKYMP